MKAKKKYGFQLKFAKAFQYLFATKADRNKAIRKIEEGIRQAGLTRADYYIHIKKGILKGKGRGRRVLKGGKRA